MKSNVAHDDLYFADSHEVFECEQAEVDKIDRDDFANPEQEIATIFATVADAEGLEDKMYRRGIAHATGVGAQYDLVQAHKWFNIAAMRGNQAARMHRASVAAMLSPEGVARALRLARDWLSGGHKVISAV